MFIRAKFIAAITLIGVFTITAVLIFSGGAVLATVPYNNEMVSVDSSGNIETGGGTYNNGQVSSSADGRYVAFLSSASNLVPGDTNNSPDIFVRDRELGTTIRADLNSSGSQVSPPSVGDFKISGNGRFVVFTGSTNAFSGWGNHPNYSIYLRDLNNNTTELISQNTSGNIANGDSDGPDISADGRYVVFQSSATDLVSGDTNGVSDIFLRDRLLGTTTLLSKNSSGTLGNASVSFPSISCDGAYVAFNSSATNLVAGDTNGETDTFLVDRINGGKITDITINGNGSAYYSNTPKISCDGSTVVFQSSASNLVAGDTNGLSDLFAWDAYSSTIDRVNVSSTGDQATDYGVDEGQGTYSVSFTGRYVAFATYSSEMTSGDTNSTDDVFLRDRSAGTTQLVSMRDASTQTNANSDFPFISADGRYITFVSEDSGLVPGDTNGQADAFIAATGI